MKKQKNISRRDFIKTTTAATFGFAAAPYINCGKIGVTKPMKRVFGRTGFEVTTLGLGGQASIQWTPEDVDPVKIIHKAFNLGVNYFDTSNLYGPSQNNYGQAFRDLHLIPGQPGYDEKLRRSIFLTSKTHIRMAKGERDVRDWTNGPRESKTVDDLKRTISLIFGDGKGNYPKGAYINMMLLHNMTALNEVDAVFEGLENPDPKAEAIGALAALRDYRDGTNRTGLNPNEETLIRHIGFSGHFSPSVMMELIQRDQENLFDGMLVAINANDRLNFNMQYNVIPVAEAKNMGLIAMKVFADGAMYTKGAHWSRKPEHVVRTVGSKDMPSRPLVEYSLTTPGIHTAIIGIGEISETAQNCQLTQNLSASQILPDALAATDRRTIEQVANRVKAGKTNYFQTEAEPLSAPREAAITQKKQGDNRIVEISWQTAFAGDEPLKHYEIWRDNQKIGEVQHKPQTSKNPFVFEDRVNDSQLHAYKLVSVDFTERKESTGEVIAKQI